MPKPLIALTMDSGSKAGLYEINSTYLTSIEKAGGIPMPIGFHTSPALIPEILDRIDGICFIGGDDLDPALYGQQWHPNAIRINPDRQKFELQLIAEVERRRLPTLGVCLGSQLMNIHRGGSLHQFLPDLPRENALEHRRLDRELPRHPIKVDVNSILGRAIGKPDVLANTYHKQAVDRLGRGLKVIATAPDGVIEGFEDPTFPLFAAVQWHPERLHDEPEHLNLFKLLVDTARHNT